MSIGYACLTIGVPNTAQKSCISKNACNEKLLELVSHNLNALEKIIYYNIKNNIRLFRISSDLIPFGSSPVNSLPWWDIFGSQLLNVGKVIKNSGMRVSMHPGQYTVLNSPDDEVVKRAIEDLNYHNKVLDSLGMGSEHKLVLHIGGIYNDKKQAMNRFIANYKLLDVAVKRRLVLENDDKSYNIKDVLEIGKILNAPIIFDNLHNKINSYNGQECESFWINECKKTWGEMDGYQKIHYSQQNPLKKPGSHSNSIGINEFMDFYEKLGREDIDIMLEVKDKNLSAIKCINCISTEYNIEALELEWNKYKYKILENSPSAYLEILDLLRNNKQYPAIAFYNLIDEALKKEIKYENSINAAMHIWTLLKDKVSETERNGFFRNIQKYRLAKIPVSTIKNGLWKLAIKYRQTHLFDSYYFVL